MDIQKHYSNKENCIKDLSLARETYSSRNTTKEQFDGMMKSLLFILLYCPEELKIGVEAHIIDAERRRMFFETNIWKE